MLLSALLYQLVLKSTFQLVLSGMVSLRLGWTGQVEPANVRDGVMLARTLLSTDAEAAVVRVINLQPCDYVLRADELVGRAEPVRVDSETVTDGR